MLDFNPQKSLLICTGVPVHRASDEILARYAREAFAGKIVMGGTTAKVISRELGLGLEVCLDYDPSGLPSHSLMEGFDLVCEGVLTLTSIFKALENGELDSRGSFAYKEGIKYQILRLLDSHQSIVFVEGECKNPAYDNLNLPIKLIPRDILIKDIVRLLREKYNKHVEHIKL